LRRKTAVITAVIIAFALLPAGCAQVSEGLPISTEGILHEELSYPVEVETLVFNESPKSVASLSPALTEIICELGYEGLLTGISTYCNYPENIGGRENIGSAANPDINAVIRIKPDLLLSQSPIAKKDIASIEESGTRVLILPATTTVEGLYQLYSDLAAIFGGRLNAESAAEEALAPLKKALAEAEGSVESFIYIMDYKLSVAPPDTFAGDFFSYFGKNVINENGKINITSEELAKYSPEYIFLTSESPASELLPAEGSRTIIIDSQFAERLERPSSRLESVVYGVLGEVG